MSDKHASSYDLMTSFNTPSAGYDWAKNFRKAFPEAEENGVAVASGLNTISIKIGEFNNDGVMASPDASILIELDSKRKWSISSLFLKENYDDPSGPSGRLLDLHEVLKQEKDPRQMVGQLIDLKASGSSLFDAVSKADNSGKISNYMESVEAGRVTPLEIKVAAANARRSPGAALREFHAN